MSAHTIVVGSLNMDFRVRVDRFPTAGETVLTTGGFRMSPGGKGANQAFTVGRLGGEVTLIGRVGEDSLAEGLRAPLRAAGVDVRWVDVDDRRSTGVAFITVDAMGQNSIVVAAGANAALEPGHLAAAAFTDGGRLLTQLEVPLATVAAALERAEEAGMTTILDPAPAPDRPLPRELLSRVDVLTPNESEARILLGESPAPIVDRDAVDVAHRLQRLGPRSVVLTLGERGALLLDRDGETVTIAPPSVVPRDTTAAGDVFNGALAVALGEEQQLPEAIAFACTAAALSATRDGAQSSVPERSEIDALHRSAGEHR